MVTTKHIVYAASALVLTPEVATGQDKPVHESPVGECTRDIPSGRSAPEWANSYALRCLKLEGMTDYDVKTAALAVSIIANGDSQQIGVIPEYTIRTVPDHPLDATDPGTFSADFWRMRLGVRSATSGNGTSAVLFDLDQGRLADGIGGVAGIEFGRTYRNQKALGEVIAKAIDVARKDCILTRIDTITKAALFGHPPVAAAATELVDEATTYCDNTSNFSNWVKDTGRGNQYFTSILAPFWGYDDQPRWWGGTELALAKPRFDYVPIGDPASSPSLNNPMTRREWVYHGQLYGGWTLRPWFAKDGVGAFTRRTISVAVVGTLAYRREAGFVPGTRDQQVCPASTIGFVTCKNINTAAPYINEGVTLSARMNIDVARAWILPGLGLGLKVSHATDTGQWAGEVPVHLFADAARSLSGGIRLGASGDGRTRGGIALAGERRLMLFIGNKFQLGQR